MLKKNAWRKIFLLNYFLFNFILFLQKSGGAKAPPPSPSLCAVPACALWFRSLQVLPNCMFTRLDYLNIRGIFIGIPVYKWLSFRFRVLCLCGFANCVIMLYCFLYTEHWNGFAASQKFCKIWPFLEKTNKNARAQAIWKNWDFCLMPESSWSVWPH